MMRRLNTIIVVVLLTIFPAALPAQYTAVVNPNSLVVTNFQGWGTSLAWWANVVGGYPNRTNYVDLAFTQLKLNIARYNIGGGQNPATNMSKQGYRTIMPGFEPTNGIWNWNADANQRWILQQAKARGVNFVDAFANSPPWWMCVNSNVDGGNVSTNNLLVNCETNFAVYLATVVSNLTVLDGVHFDYVTPMNEPVGSKWSITNANLQEGCDMSRDQQVRVINDLYAQLQAGALSVGIDAAEDTDPTQTYNDLTSYSSYSAATLGYVSLFSTHTYPLNGYANLKSEASSQHKTLWVTEDGESDASGLTMARFIYTSVAVMGARAWCYWQFVDSAGGWGFLLNSLQATTNASYTPNYTINEKFYVMGQFSEFIRPGCNIIAVNDTNTLAAFNPTNSTLVLVLINNTASSTNVTYNLSSFGPLPWQVAARQTAPGENLATILSPVVTNQQFSAAVPATSVTTFVLTTNVTAPVITNQFPTTYTGTMTVFAGQTPTFSVLATGSVPLYYYWYSNGVVVATSTSYTPPAISTGGQVSFACVVSNMAGTATSQWSVAVSSPPTASYPTAALALHPVGYWRLNETRTPGIFSGGIAIDSVGGNNGIYTNVLLSQMSYNTTTDPNDTSAVFGFIAANNSCAYGIVGPDFALPNGSNAEFTVSAWVNSRSNNSLNTPTIAAKGYYNGEEYALDAGASDCYRFSVRNAAGTAYSANSTVSLSSSGVWYHLVGVCDEAHGLVLLYTNGVLTASAPIPTASGIVNSSQVPMTIGSRSSNPGNGYDQQFPGYIADVAIYNYALSASQIQTLYQSGVSFPPVGLNLSNLNGNAMQLNWNYGVLQSATNVAGPYMDMTNITAPYTISPTNGQQFFRIRQN